jgi:hypothetical protein
MGVRYINKDKGNMRLTGYERMEEMAPTAFGHRGRGEKLSGLFNGVRLVQLTV